MDKQKMLDAIASYDYGVYLVDGKIVIADPIGGPDSFYLTVDTVEDAYKEMIEGEFIKDTPR